MTWMMNSRFDANQLVAIFMTPEDFKSLWQPGKFNRWAELDVHEIEKAPLSEATKNFLRLGFPEDAAPFLSFGWRSNKGKFNNLYETYPGYGAPSTSKNFWIIGDDGEGNPICFDVSRHDRLVLLDHEQNFEIISVVNTNIAELAECLLLYKNFISKAQRDNGENAYLEADFSMTDIAVLKESFKQINDRIFKESSFWRSEINALEKEIK